MPEDEAVEIYFTGEWPASPAGQLAVPLGEISFDMTVLDGAGRAMRALQNACGLTGADIDGAWSHARLAGGSLSQPGRGASEASKISQRLA